MPQGLRVRVSPPVQNKIPADRPGFFLHEIGDTSSLSRAESSEISPPVHEIKPPSPGGFLILEHGLATNLKRDYP